MEAYTTAVHGIKSALANIGEAKLSEFAFKLEKAGEAGNFGVVAGETPAFINKLKALVAKLKPREISGGAPVSSDDMLLLREKLPEFKTACEELNLRAAKAILNDLRQKTWPREVDDAINEISVSLLRGEYKKVVSIAEKLAR